MHRFLWQGKQVFVDLDEIIALQRPERSSGTFLVLRGRESILAVDDDIESVADIIEKWLGSHCFD